MNHFETTILGRLLEPALSLRLALTLLHFLWQGALLGLAAFAADRVLRRASSRTRYAIFVGILAIMGAALPATFLLVRTAEPQNELATALKPTPAAVVMTNSSPAVTPRAIAKASRSADSIPETEPELITDLGPTDAFLESPPTANELPTARLKPYAAAVTLAYLTGIVLMLTRLAIALQGGRRLRLAATPIPDGPIAELVRRQAIQLGLKTAPLVAWCTRNSVPVVVGILRPMILLPSALATGFDPSQLEALLTHELAHIRRFDPLVNLLQRLIEVLLFFHPAVWYVSRRVSAERENACDDLVVSAGWPAVRYAQALLQMAEFCAAARGIAPQPNTALAASGANSSQFKRRVLRLLEIEDSPKVRISRGGVLLLAATAVLVGAIPTLIRRVTAQDQAVNAPVQADAAAPLVDRPGTANKSSAALDRVLAAWKKRQDRVRSFHFVWDTRMILPKGFSFPNQPPVIAGLDSWGVDVDLDKAMDFTIPKSEWWGQGTDRFRSDLSRVAYDETAGWKQRARLRLIDIGQLHSRLQVPLDRGQAPLMSIWRTVSINNPRRSRGLAGDSLGRNRNVDLGPLRLSFRPFAEPPDNSLPYSPKANVWTPENCKVVGENAIVGAVHCIKLEHHLDYILETCWVDPNRDDVVVLWERQQRNMPARSVSIEYQHDHDQGWVPSRWSWQASGLVGGGARTPASFEATVTSYKINEKFRDDPFANTSPPDTRVYDVTVDRPTAEASDRSDAVQAQESRRTLGAITAAWTRRQARYKSFKFSWKRQAAERGASSHTVCVDGDRFASQYQANWDMPVLQMSANDRRPRRERSPTHSGHEFRVTFDGKTTTRYSISNGDAEPLVTLSAGHDDTAGQFPGDKYLLYTFRPMDRELRSIDLSKFKVAPGGGTIGDTPCVVIETDVVRGDQQSFWLDPARDYLVLREHWTLNGQDCQRVDLTYRPDPTYGWIPTAWVDANAGSGGSMGSACTDTVTNYSINQPVPNSEFKIEIPKGAQVNDMRKRNS